MITVSVGYIPFKAKCDLCSHIWVGTVEVDVITTDDVTTYKQPAVECPNCSHPQQEIEPIKPE